MHSGRHQAWRRERGLVSGLGVNVCNKDVPNLDTSNYINNVNGVSTQTGYKWECVELVNCLYLTRGWTTAFWQGNGGGDHGLIYNAPSNLNVQLNGSVTHINPGDVITLSNTGNPSGSGHTAIIDTVGSTIGIVNQNAQAVASSATLSSGTVSMAAGTWTNYTVQAIVHHPGGGGGTPTDTDGDTVPDSQDWCPIVPGNPVNHGCPNDVVQVSGDVNGDGKDDAVAISRNMDNSPGINWFPSTSSSGTASLSSPQSGNVSLPAPAWNVDHLKWTVGDYNGDGKDDLAVVSGSSADPPNMYILLATGSGFASPQLVKQPNPAYWQWPRLQFMAGDVNGDGESDLYYISKNGDNSPSIGWFQSTSSGSTAALADPVGLKAPGAGWLVDHLKWTIGDFNGDSKDDAFAMSGSAADPPNMYIFTSGGNSLANPVLVKQPNPAYWQWPRLQF